MKLPFTPEQFFAVFRNYNQTIFPLQILFYIFALICIWLLFSGKQNKRIIISAFLSFFWMWVGIVYHIVFFSAINGAAYLFGALFIIQGLIFLYYGVIKKEIAFGWETSVFGITGLVLILYALVIYPLLGLYFGHVYPNSPTFGLPCPTTIFTFGLLMCVTKKPTVKIYIIPFVWSIIGFGAALKLFVFEDVGLLFSGFLGVGFLLMKKRI